MLKTYLQKLLGELGVIHAKTSTIVTETNFINGNGNAFDWDLIAPFSSVCSVKITVKIKIYAAGINGIPLIQFNPNEADSSSLLHKTFIFPVRKGDNIKISIATLSGENGPITATYCPTNKLTL